MIRHWATVLSFQRKLSTFLAVPEDRWASPLLLKYTPHSIDKTWVQKKFKAFGSIDMSGEKPEKSLTTLHILWRVVLDACFPTKIISVLEDSSICTKNPPTTTSRSKRARKLPWLCNEFFAEPGLTVQKWSQEPIASTLWGVDGMPIKKPWAIKLPWQNHHLLELSVLQMKSLPASRPSPALAAWGAASRGTEAGELWEIYIFTQDTREDTCHLELTSKDENSLVSRTPKLYVKVITGQSEFYLLTISDSCENGYSQNTLLRSIPQRLASYVIITRRIAYFLPSRCPVLEALLRSIPPRIWSYPT